MLLFMNKLLTSRAAATGIAIILSVIIVFHLLVVSRVIPYDIVWGGNISDSNDLWLMEAVSIAVNALLLFLVFAYMGVIKVKVNRTVTKVFFWVMFIFFLLNTLGNILAKQSLETFIFTPLTVLLSLFSFRIAMNGELEKKP